MPGRTMHRCALAASLRVQMLACARCACTTDCGARPDPDPALCVLPCLHVSAMQYDSQQRSSAAVPGSQRTVFAFTPISAPYKATVFPLLQRAELDAPATAIAARLRAAGLSTKIDTSSACFCGPGIIAFACRAFDADVMPPEHLPAVV